VGKKSGGLLGSVSSFGGRGRRGGGGLLSSAYSGRKKSRRGLSILSVFGKTSRTKSGATSFVNAKTFTIPRKRKKSSGATLSLLTDQVAGKRGKNKKRPGIVQGIAGSFASFNSLQGNTPPPSSPTAQQGPLPDVPVQEGTTDNPTSVLIRFQELMQSLPEFPENQPAVFARLREFAQSLPPLPEAPSAVFDVFGDFLRDRLPPRPERPKSVFQEIGDYVRSLRPRGKR